MSIAGLHENIIAVVMRSADELEFEKCCKWSYQITLERVAELGMTGAAKNNMVGVGLRRGNAKDVCMYMDCFVQNNVNSRIVRKWR